MATALASLMSLPHVPLVAHPSPVHPLDRLAATLGPDCPRLLIKRDDLLTFGWGGNKVRKLQLVLAEARAAGADTLITCGGLQSNHARVTAAAGAVLDMRVVLVLNGEAPPTPTGNLKLDALFGANVRLVASREARSTVMAEVAEEVRAAGATPFVIPLGASTATGALGFARAVAELSAASVRPDAIIHASSSGGTQAGLVAGCALLGLSARIIGVSADEPAAGLGRIVSDLLAEMAVRLGAKPGSLGAERPIEVDDRQVGDGYGVPTPASAEATTLLARREGVVVDPVYTSKALAGLIAQVRAGAFGRDETVLFWHTGGQPL
jgi:1-aminocyclopropane-1-carboxylate deaminase/D-cysteine desulfhydrase-like pyridoxal-dependent ACC family enzyme